MRFGYEMLSQAVNRISTNHLDLLGTTWRTIWLALAATAVAALIGVPLGTAIGQARARRRRVLAALANAGLGLPAVVLGVFVGLLLLPASPLGFLDWRDDIHGVFLVQVVFALPIVTALTASAVTRQADDVLRQARAFGAGRLARGRLALREARVGVTAAIIAALGSAVGEVAAVTMVGGNVEGHTNTLPSTVLIDLAAGDLGSALADVLLLLLIVAVLGTLLTTVQQRGRRSGAAA